MKQVANKQADPVAVKDEDNMTKRLSERPFFKVELIIPSAKSDIEFDIKKPNKIKLR